MAGLAGLAGRPAAQPGRGADRRQVPGRACDAGKAGPASCVPPEAWRRPPQPEYLVFAGSQGRLVQLILAQAVGLGHLRGRLFEA